MKKRLIKIMFALVLCSLFLALAFTIVGSSANHNGLLNTGIVLWLAASALFFVWVVLLIWSRTKKYGR